MLKKKKKNPLHNKKGGTKLLHIDMNDSLEVITNTWFAGLADKSSTTSF